MRPFLSSEGEGRHHSGAEDTRMESKRESTELRNWFRQYRFNWIGRTKDGVSRWIGAPQGPSERICKNLTRYGIVMGVAGLCAMGAMAIYPPLWSALLWL